MSCDHKSIVRNGVEQKAALGSFSDHTGSYQDCIISFSELKSSNDSVHWVIDSIGLFVKLICWIIVK